MGAKLTCGHCDRRTPPRRFQPSVDVRLEPTCGYCGHATANRTRICDDCKKLKTTVEQTVSGDDRVLLEINRRLAAGDRRAKEAAEIAEMKEKRIANQRRREREWDKAA
jgi:hypothetical protein